MWLLTSLKPLAEFDGTFLLYYLAQVWCYCNFTSAELVKTQTATSETWRELRHRLSLQAVMECN